MQSYDYWSDGAQWPSHSSGFIRAHAVRYKTDEKGRTRWYAESRFGDGQGLSYQEVEILVPAGFMTSPKVGEMNELLLLEVNGDRGQLLAIPIGDSEKRQKLPEGWVGVANPDMPNHHYQVDDQGNLHVHAPDKTIFINEAKQIVLKSTQDIVIETPTLRIKGKIEHEGDYNQAGIHTDNCGRHTPKA